MKTLLKLAGVALALSVSAPAMAVTTIGNTPSGSDISTFGTPDSKTYGQVFTAPVTGKITKFTFWLNGAVGTITGAIGSWNGPATYAAGSGSPTLIAKTAEQASVFGANSFSLNGNVVAGQRYVAYISTFGTSAAAGTTSMPRGTAAANLNYFVWNNTSDPDNNGSWNYFSNLGNAQFEATFGGVPEPATWAFMILGFGMIGSAMRRKGAVRTKVAYA